MKKISILTIVIGAFLFLPFMLSAADFSALVSTDWLSQNLTNEKVKIIDVRKVEDFKESHIPGSFNLFYGSWAIKVKDLQNELPPEEDLRDLIGSLGITPESFVVIVGKSDSVPELTASTRVAWTLKYAGLKNIAILDGGFTKWVKEKKPVVAEIVAPKAIEYKGKFNKTVYASKEDVFQAAGKKITLVDNRGPDAFFGVMKLDFVAKAGHMKGAVNLPSAWAFTKDGEFKPKADLEAMAAGVVGNDKKKGIIVYCDTGRVASVWWFIFSEVLGYSNVKNYDGSMEELAKDPNAPIVRYSW